MENKSNKKINPAVYVFCAFMIVGLICISIFTAVGSKKTTDTASDTTEVTDTQPDTAETSDTTDTSSDTESSNDEAISAEEYFFPVNGGISKAYSVDTPVFSQTMNDYRSHKGVDVISQVGTAVCAFADGTVTKKYTDHFMGECLEITHENGMVSKYMNLAPDFPEEICEGVSVYGGQTIGCVGETAALEAADEAHLHFEIVSQDANVNPADYLDFEAAAPQYEDTSATE